MVNLVTEVFHIDYYMADFRNFFFFLCFII